MFYKISHGGVTIDGNTILEDINFQITDLEKVGIVGRNGCGGLCRFRPDGGLQKASQPC